MRFNNKIICVLFLIGFYELKVTIDKRKILYNYEFNVNNINDLAKLKKVVYTILIGKYDKVHSIKKEKGYDYFMLTDQQLKNYTKSNWTILYLDKKTKYKSKKEKIKRQRFYKTHPHLLFKNYDLSIYIDATYKIKGNLDDFLLRILTPNISIYLLEHPDRNSIHNEFNAVIHYRKESRKNIDPIKKKYKKERYPDNNGLAETCLIIRKHNELNCIYFMEEWFNEIKQYSHRDQLSFNYILWKTRNKFVKYISKKSTTFYFRQYQRHINRYYFKY